MTNKNIYKYAKLYYKNNKKRYRSIVYGLSISLSFIIIVFFMLLGFDMSIKSNLKKYPSASTITLTYKIENESIINDNISNIKGISNSIVFYDYSIDHLSLGGMGFNRITYYPSIEVDGTKYEYDNPEYKESMFSYFDDNADLFTKSELRYFKDMNIDDPIIGRRFNPNEKEVLVSSLLLEDLGLTSLDVLGKSVSFISPQFINREIVNVPYFENYTIVGVFNSEIYRCPSRGNLSRLETMFWLSDSLEREDFPDDELSIRKKLIEFSSFDSCLNAYNEFKILDNKMRDENKYFLVIANNLFYDYTDYLPIIEAISIFLSIFSGSILLLCIINLINNLVYEAKIRKSYIAMCKAIGFTNKDVFCLNLFEILIIFIRVTIISLIATFIACLGITLLMNSISNSIVSESLILVITFNFITYPIVLFVVLITLLIFIISISIPLYRVNSKNIIKDLKS